MSILIAKSKRDAIAEARRLNKNPKYGYRYDISSMKYKGKSKRTGYKTYTIRKMLKNPFRRYASR